MAKLEWSCESKRFLYQWVQNTSNGAQKNPSVLAVLTMKMQTVFEINLPAIIKQYVDDAALLVGRCLVLLHNQA